MKHLIIYLILIPVLLSGYCSFKASPEQESSNKYQLKNGEELMIKKVEKTDKEWKETLTPEQYRVMRKGGTEKPFSGKYNDFYDKGMYYCSGCGTPLFSSETKYDHSTGWPSFTAPVNENSIVYLKDNSFLMERTEVRCAVCGAHLGHVFDDSPFPTHKHYCINSVCLNFKKAESSQVPKSNTPKIPDKSAKKAMKTEKATFAAGCFWGVEHKFRQTPGILSTMVGYTGGHVKKPSYKQVCSDTTGHAEALEIIFDPSRISYEQLLDVFFHIHDPTQFNRQGPDIGTQYRSVIFFHSEKQKESAKKKVEQLQKSGRFDEPIVTEIKPASEFYKAEEYHQQYIEKRTKG